MSHDEQEMKEFGEYIIRYMPMLFQNAITENMINSLTTGKSLHNLERLLKDKFFGFKTIK